MNERVGNIIATLVFAAFTGYMTYTYWTCIRDGRIYFGQWKDVRRSESPRKYLCGILYHTTWVIAFNLATLVVVLKYIFGVYIP